jgi:hypothetical protein
MSVDNPAIIADGRAASRARRLAAGVFAAAIAAGTLAAIHYARIDLTLSHYDARAHLVVARRIVDSLTPGWRQIGAVWLPLPHLLDLVAVLPDWGYRSGYPAVAISIGSLAAGLAALAAYVWRQTASTAAALAAPALILANPNLLYLQSTPMTEPLLLGLMGLSVLAVDRWIEQPSPRTTWQARAALAALALTRYEGWCFAAAVITVGALLQWRRGARVALALAPALVGAIAGFLLLGYATTGAFFVSDGFFVPDNPAHHAPLVALHQIVAGTRALGGDVLVGGAVIGTVVGIVALVRRRAESLSVALVATAALPFYAFYEGHPLRVRYMIPIVAVCGLLAASAIARLPRRLQAVIAAAFVAIVCWQRPPLDAHAPMVLEAQWETPFRLQRQAVTRYLSGVYDGTPILASMGSLGHYMQETSRAGFPLASFLHEGNGDLWVAALARPSRYVHWILIEERAEGGDMLAARLRDDPTFVDGFTRVAEGGGLVLYRATGYRPRATSGIDPQ